MSFQTFFPSDIVSALFVAALIAWFAFWLHRLRAEATHLDWVGRLFTNLDQCIEQLRTQQLWRDRQRLQGNNVIADPAAFFNDACASKLGSGGKTLGVIQGHFRAIFVAGCEESALDAAELNAQTCEEIGNKSEQLRNELILLFLFGVLGTLLALSRRYGSVMTASLESQRTLPPLIWGAMLTIAGGVLYLNFQGRKLAPTLAELRRKTTTLWIPRLYPTVAQRAAQWAIHTLQNAARVTDASAIIEQHAVKFVGAVETARHAAEAFSGGMKEFSHGIDASDRALQTAQTRLAAEVEKFADSLHRWGKFEDEIRRFYSAVEANQKQIVNEHKTFEAMLAGYYDLVRQSTSVLQQSASDLGSAAALLPQAFQNSADKMTQSAAEFQQYLATVVTGMATQITSAYREDSAEVQARLQTIVEPVLNMENRLRALGAPFESASNKLLEIAENLWRLNDNFEQKVSRAVEELQAGQSRAAKSGG